MTEEAPRLGLVRRYLSAQGWQRHSLSIRELDLYSNPDAEGIEIVLPTTPDVQDTPKRVRQAVRTLADLSDMAFENMERIIKGIGFDLVEAALPDAKVFRQSIKMRVAESFLRWSRNLMKHAAIAEYESIKVEDAIRSGTEYADDCQFGHTFAGSFGFRILSPVGPNSSPDVDEEILPTERRIVMRLEHGLSSIARAQAQGDPRLLVNDAVIGLNSDGYDSVARLLESSETNDVTFAFHMSPEWKTSADEISSGPIRIASAAIPLLKDASRSLRKVDYDLPEMTVIGRVVRLYSKNVPTDLFHPGGREIALQWESQDFGVLIVRARLPPDQYLEAIYAHEQGRNVEVRGVIEPYAGGFRFLNVLSFHVL